MADDHDFSERFFHRARAAQAVLHSADASPKARANAARIWTVLYRAVHASLDEVSAEQATRIAEIGAGAERAARIAKIDAEAAKAVLSPIMLHLREFALGIAHEVMTAPDPVKSLDGIINGPRLGGRPGRDPKQRIRIAALVEEQRASMSLTGAIRLVSETISPRIDEEALRRIYENATRTKARKSLVRLIAAAKGEWAFPIPGRRPRNPHP
jgi:hypothetical protein